MRRMLVILALLVAHGETASPARADEALTQGLDRLAANIAEFLKSEELARSVVVGDFIAPPRLIASGGAGLSNQIAKALEKHQVKVDPSAKVQLLGRFTVRQEKEFRESNFESVSLRIRAELLDDQDDTLQILNISVFGQAALQIAGATTDLPPEENAEDQEKRKQKALTNPSVAIVGNEARASRDSPYGLEVLVTSAPRPLTAENGRAFVELNQSEEYVIRLHNRSKFEAAVELTIDGLDMFVLSEDGSFGSRVLVAPRRSVDIPGWYVNGKISRAFVITSLPDGLASQRNIPSTKIGTITASFAAAWEPSADPPADEPSPKSADQATGAGREIDKKYEQVQRVIGAVRSVVSVRYTR